MKYLINYQHKNIDFIKLTKACIKFSSYITFLLFINIKSIFATADLEIDLSYLVNNIYISVENFSSNDCNVDQGCTIAGQRKLLRFGLRTMNVGTKKMKLGKTPKDGKSKGYFVWHKCHDHHHFTGFAKYELFDVNCNQVIIGKKLGGCVMDSEPISGTNLKCVQPIAFGCEVQGIHPGCADVYPPTLDCQYLDITSIPDGKYFLKLRINFDQNLIQSHSELQESDYSNNTAYVLIEIQGNLVTVIYIAHTIPYNKNIHCGVLSIIHEGLFFGPPRPFTRLARNDLTVNCNITSNGQPVTLIAGNSVRMTDGFRSGDNFRAYTLDPCLINLRVAGNSEILFDDYTIPDMTQDQTKDNTINDETLYPNDGIHLYPNPSSGIFNLYVKFEQEKKTKIVVYNIFGKEIYSVSESPILQKNYQINLSSYPNGIYIVRLITNDAVINKKMILSK